MRRSLSDRLKQHNQQRARLEAREAALREAERASKRRTLLSSGVLVENAGLLRLGTEALYGALISLERGAADPRTVEQWTSAGRERLAHEAAEAAKLREALIISFPETIAPPTKVALRAAGFRWVKEFGSWIGTSTIAEAEALASVHHGKVKRIDQPEDDDLPIAAE
jgi:hypothetical protein